MEISGFIFDDIKLILDPRGKGMNVKILIGRLIFFEKKHIFGGVKHWNPFCSEKQEDCVLRDYYVGQFFSSLCYNFGGF